MQLDKTASEKEWLIYQRLARRAKNGYKVPEGFLDCAASFGQFFVTVDKAMKGAEKLAQMRRSDEYGCSDLAKIRKEYPMNTIFEEAIYAHIEGKYKQSDKAKHDRPKKKPTKRILTIEAMRKSRANEHTLKEFIETAANGSVDGLELNESEKDNKRVFELVWDSLPLDEKEEAKLTAYSTLENWWAATLKKPI